MRRRINIIITRMNFSYLRFFDIIDQINVDVEWNTIWYNNIRASMKHAGKDLLMTLFPLYMMKKNIINKFCKFLFCQFYD